MARDPGARQDAFWHFVYPLQKPHDFMIAFLAYAAYSIALS